MVDLPKTLAIFLIQVDDETAAQRWFGFGQEGGEGGEFTVDYLLGEGFGQEVGLGFDCFQSCHDIRFLYLLTESTCKNRVFRLLQQRYHLRPCYLLDGFELRPALHLFHLFLGYEVGFFQGFVTYGNFVIARRHRFVLVVCYL